MEYKSLLETTQNTRDLGGYETCYGRKTKSFSVLRSDRQGYASDRDKKFLVNHDITTVIDMRTEEDVKKKFKKGVLAIGVLAAEIGRAHV